MTGANQISLRDNDEKFIEMIWDLSLIKYKKNLYTVFFQFADNNYEKIFR